MTDATPRTVLNNIQAIVRLGEEQRRKRMLSDRIGDAVGGFAGTVGFVVLHLAVFVAWACINTGLVPIVPAWDPYPFALLTMLVSMEGVLLVSFVLIMQNRAGAITEQRNHLDLQINLLTEKEVTKLIQMLERISAHMGIEAEVTDAETRELGQVTAVDRLARTLDAKLTSEG